MGLDRVVDYIRAELWEAEPPEVIRGARERVRKAVRLVYLAVRGFFHDGGVHRASELAFDSVLATVPLLAIIFSALKGLGAYDMFVAQTVRPWIIHTFGPAGQGDVATRSTLRDAFMRLLDLVDKTEVSHLGLAGLVALLYIVLILLSTVETALNEVYGVRKARSLVRRGTDYAAMLFVAPFTLAVAATVGGWVGSLGLPSAAMAVLSYLGVPVLVALALTVLYVVIPHRRVRVGSAFVGSLVGSILFYAGLLLHAKLQFGVARYNAIYSGFAALPLFFIWVFLSWIAVLIGAELAAAHEDEAEFRWRIKDAHPSEEAREVAAVRMLIEVARAFARDDGTAPRRKELARSAKVPVGLARIVLEQLQRQGLVTEAVREDHVAYLMARNPSHVRISEVIAALRCDSERKVPGVNRDRRVASRLGALYDAMEGTDADATLADLAQEWERTAREGSRAEAA